MRLRNEALDDLVRLEPVGGIYKGYELRDERVPGMVTSMSKKGAELFAASAVIFEELRPILTAWMAHFADVECPHGVRFDAVDEDENRVFAWSVNDYAFDLETEPERAVLILRGYHYHLEDSDWFCLPAWFDAAVGAFTWDMQPSWYEASRGLQIGYLPKWVREALP